jgi:hypothetical protein
VTEPVPNFRDELLYFLRLVLLAGKSLQMEHRIRPLLFAGGCRWITLVECRQIVIKFMQLIGYRLRFSVALGKELGFSQEMRPAALKLDVVAAVGRPAGLY